MRVRIEVEEWHAPDPILHDIFLRTIAGDKGDEKNKSTIWRERHRVRCKARGERIPIGL